MYQIWCQAWCNHHLIFSLLLLFCRWKNWGLEGLVICSRSRVNWNLNSELNTNSKTQLHIIYCIEYRTRPQNKWETTSNLWEKYSPRTDLIFSEKQDEACLDEQTPRQYNFQKLVNQRLKLKTAFSKVFPIYKVTIFTIINLNSLITLHLWLHVK